VIPDYDYFANYFETYVKCQMKLKNNKVPWLEKTSKAYFRGRPTGKWFNSSEYSINR
jgi:hypothetical protein